MKQRLLEFIGNVKNGKKFLIIVFVVFLMCGVIGFFIYQSKSHNQADKKENDEKTSQLQDVELYFNPHDITADKNYPYRTTGIYVNSGGNSLTGIETVLLYDPSALKDVSVVIPLESVLKKHGDFKVLKNEVNSADGIITLSIGITDPQRPISISGLFASLNYSHVAGYNKPTTVVAFLNKTQITQVDGQKPAQLSTKPLLIRTGK